MSVLIKGMEMPSCCGDGCDFLEPIGLKCLRIHKFLDREDYLHERDKDCPLVEIPEPYGRLVDDNAMYLALAIIMAGTLAGGDCRAETETGCHEGEERVED